MSKSPNGPIDLFQSAYLLALKEFEQVSNLTAEEKRCSPGQLREQVRILSIAGEFEPQKVAMFAVAMLRQQQQIARSKARIASRAKRAVARDADPNTTVHARYAARSQPHRRTNPPQTDTLTFAENSDW